MAVAVDGEKPGVRGRHTIHETSKTCHISGGMKGVQLKGGQPIIFLTKIVEATLSTVGLIQYYNHAKQLMQINKLLYVIHKFVNVVYE